MDDFLIPEETNDNCTKMMHTWTLDIGIPVFTTTLNICKPLPPSTTLRTCQAMMVGTHITEMHVISIDYITPLSNEIWP